MKKDKKWFIDKWTKERDKTSIHEPMYYFINDFITDVKELDEPEVLSKEWIDEHEKLYWMAKEEEVVEVKDLQNLLVPKQEEVDRAYKDGYEKGKEHATRNEEEPDEREQLETAYKDILNRGEFWFDDKKYVVVETVEITEEQVMKWLDNNDFYDHITAETVLANAVDKGELGYYGTKYSVVEKPVIPKYVAEWITKHRDTFDLYPMLKRLEKNSSTWELTYKWYRTNTHEFVSAYLTGEYEVEEEPLYHALIKGHELVHDYDIYWNYDKSNHDVFVSRLHPPLDNFTTEMSKLDWIRLGINDSNADFVKVEEME